MAVQKSGVELVAIGYQQYIQQMQNINNAHKEAFSDKHANTYSKGHKKIRDEAQKTQGVVGNLRKALAALGSGDVIGAITSLRGAFMAARGGIIAFVAAVGAVKLINFVKQSVDVAARNQELAVSLGDVGKQAGYTAEQIAWATEKVKDQGITTKSAQQALLQMAQANIEWSQASDLARVAQNAAVIGMLDSSAAFERVITGIQRGEIEILKTIGLNVNFESSYKRLAQQLGKNTKELTEQEKLQARVNEVMRAGGNISGVYKAAMTTAGKQQRSLARHIEETQNSLGKMFLSIKSASIALQTDFWKGTEKATKGLTLWGAVISETIRQLQGIDEQTGDTQGAMATFGEFLGRQLHSTAQTFIQFSTIVGAALASASVAIGEFLSGTGQAVNKFINLDFKGVGESLVSTSSNMQKAFTETFHENLKANVKAMLDTFPDLLKSFDELGDVAETDLNRTGAAADRAVAELQKLKDTLEQQAKALEQVESIQKDYQRSLDKAAESYNKNFNKLIKQFEKDKVKLREKTNKSLRDLDIDADKQRAKLIKEANRSQVEEAKQLYRDLEQERRRFELSQLQSLRRFKLSEKRLQAEGDILGLIQLREDFDLQQKENKENFDLQQKEAKESAAEQQRRQQEDLQERLQELEESVRERRQEIQDSYQQELGDLVESNQERKAEMVAAYQEQLADLKENRDRQLEEMAQSLQREGNITEEGMKVIAEKIAEVFGDQGIADLLMQAWAERSTTAVSQAMQDIQAQIEAVDAQITALQTGEAPPRVTEATRSMGSRARRPRRGRGMRSGGIGVVTGPALFEVEPGHTEMVAFAPVGKGARNVLDVNVSGGMDIRGSEGASPGIVDAAVEQMMADFSAAVRRLTKR